MVKRHYTGNQLFWFVLLLLLLYSVCFILFQYKRERYFKIEVLSLKLQDYNNQISEAIALEGNNKEVEMGGRKYWVWIRLQ